jgi:hypothetical protein
LVDLLRASHKEGAFRVERDRQGVIRVFQSGSAGLAAGKAPDASPAPAPAEPSMAAVVELAETAPAVAAESASAEAPTKKKRAARSPKAPSALEKKTPRKKKSS